MTSQGKSSGGSTAENTANQAYDAVTNPTDTASEAYDKGSEYIPNLGDGKTTAASILNSDLFSSFKPDPSIVWQGHLIYVLLAAGSTLPFWTFIVAVDYFQFLYPGMHIIRLFIFAYYLPWLVVFLLVASFWREASAWIKITVGLSISIVMLVLIPVVNGVFIGDEGNLATFWVTLVAVAICGCADSVSQITLAGIASELPVSFSKAYCDGATASGVFVFIVRIIIKASFSSSGKGLRIGGIVYFSVAALFLVLVIAVFAYVHSMPEMDYYNSLGLGSFEVVRLLIENEDSVTIEVSSGAAIATVAAGRSNAAQPLHWNRVMNKTKILSIAMFITPCITLSIFPGLLAEDLSNLDYLGSYSPLLLLGTYIIFDLVGRLILASTMPERHSTVFGTAWIRLLLVGLFIVAYVFYSSFILLLVLTAILGVSNGYVIATITVINPRAVTPDLKETAGILNALMMNLGILVGAGLSWIWVIGGTPTVHLLNSTYTGYGSI